MLFLVSFSDTIHEKKSYKKTEKKIDKCEDVCEHKKRDNINEKFYDIIGDNIIESIDNIEIYEDYIEDVKNYLKEENIID